jgi:hypothetical protein
MAVSVLFLAIGLVGCGGPGGGDAAAAGEPDSLDFEGLWTVDYECDEGSMGSFTLEMTVNGADVTGEGVDTESGFFEFVGEVQGDRVVWSQSYDGGIQEVTTYRLTSATTLDKGSVGTGADGTVLWTCTGAGVKQVGP